MAAPRTLAELLAAAEARKAADIRSKLGLAADSPISGIELESLAYHLTERSGPVALKLEGDELRVGEPGASTYLSYRGPAIAVVLKAWSVDESSARAGISFEVQNGRRS
jgi:hypothetical protein